MAPLRSESDEMDERVPKILCCMTNHLGLVAGLIVVDMHVETCR